MNAVVIAHVPVGELPAQWRAKLANAADALVTVRIEEEAPTTAPADTFITNDPAFGIWRDHDDVADVAAYVRKLREPRYNRDGSQKKA
jgi:hypothetical protein